MANTVTFNPKQQCYINTIRESIFYHTIKNDGRKPTVIFMSKPLWILLGGISTNKTKSRFDGIRILVFDDESYSYYFADERQKGREP